MNTSSVPEVSVEEYLANEIEVDSTNFSKPNSVDQFSKSGISSRVEAWKLCGEKFPSSQIQYTFQIFILSIIIFVSLTQLCLSTGDKTLWNTLLCTSIGYILPSPKIKSSQNKNGAIHHPSE